ncbi:hypothetical protein [Spectribacter hydrogenoxidans]|uniref:Collagen, middle region n=1 Tax=Spectribacter hydrogenoxidans TaxID=3075608 RepID=A0ABU3C4V9_9GAMM|nr:hypothetical protein [Salinisphaera sp. W335]MDT0636394.1 hypothetical protein [Salinisphaera sp. W335]
MKHILGKFIPLLLALYASGASAQDAGNLLAATDHAVGNVNTVLQGLLTGDAAGAVDGVETLVTDLGTDLADGTPLETALSDDIIGSGMLVQPLLDRVATPVLGVLVGPLADAGAPLISRVNSPALLDNLPVIQGENLAFLGPHDSLGQYLASSGVPLDLIDVLLRVDLLGPGDGDGGGVLVPVFGGTASAAPQILSELGGTVQSLTNNPAETSLLLRDVQRLLEFVASNPFAGGSLPVPLLGLLVGDFSILPGGGGGGLPGLDPAQLPLPAGELDAGTLTALASGATLPGLE